MQCEHRFEDRGPHEGCAEFMDTTSRRCSAPAVKRYKVDSEDLAEGIRGQMGGWENYRANMIADPNEEDPGEDPGEANWGIWTLNLCSQHGEEFVADGADMPGDRLIEITDIEEANQDV